MDCFFDYTSHMTRTTITLALAFAFVLLVAFGIWTVTTKKDTNDTKENTTQEEIVITVKTKEARDTKSATFEERLPARIVPANETAIVAETSGTVSSVSFEVGQSVTLGETLVRITNPTGTTLAKSGIQSEAVRQAEITASLTRKSYKEAKRLAEKDSSKENSLARDLARLRLESAEIDLANALDASIVRAPLSGIVSEKNVGLGSSVSPGTVLATIASSGMPKAQFQISESLRLSLKTGDSVRVLHEENREETARITSIASIADPATGKFAVEARFEKSLPISGTIAIASLQTTRSASSTSEFFLPLSAITTGQDGSYFFVTENETAKKITITSLSVSGETALVKADISEDAHIIIESAGTLEDGMKVQKNEKE